MVYENGSNMNCNCEMTSLGMINTLMEHPTSQFLLCCFLDMGICAGNFRLSKCQGSSVAYLTNQAISTYTAQKAYKIVVIVEFIKSGSVRKQRYCSDLSYAAPRPTRPCTAKFLVRLESLPVSCLNICIRLFSVGPCVVVRGVCLRIL